MSAEIPAAAPNLAVLRVAVALWVTVREMVHVCGAVLLCVVVALQLGDADGEWVTVAARDHVRLHVRDTVGVGESDPVGVSELVGVWDRLRAGPWSLGYIDKQFIPINKFKFIIINQLIQLANIHPNK